MIYIYLTWSPADIDLPNSVSFSKNSSSVYIYISDLVALGKKFGRETTAWGRGNKCVEENLQKMILFKVNIECWVEI